MDEFIITILKMYKGDRCNLTFAVNIIKSAMYEAIENAMLGEEDVIKESLFFQDCGNRKCVYNMKGNCRCRNIGSECQGYKKVK